MTRLRVGHLLLIATSTRRELQAHVWIPSAKAGKPAVGPLAIVTLTKGQFSSISGIGTRLAKADSEIITAFVVERAALIDLALAHLVNRVMVRGKFGSMPFRPYRLEVGALTDALSAGQLNNVAAKLVLRPIARYLESLTLIMPAGSDQLLITRLNGVQYPDASGFVTVGKSFYPPKSPVQLLPLLRQRWRTQTPSGAPVADAFTSIVDELGPGLRHSISELIAAFD